jgi:hypothetical protein
MANGIDIARPQLPFDQPREDINFDRNRITATRYDISKPCKYLRSIIVFLDIGHLDAFSRSSIITQPVFKWLRLIGKGIYHTSPTDKCNLVVGACYCDHEGENRREPGCRIL